MEKWLWFAILAFMIIPMSYAEDSCGLTPSCSTNQTGNFVNGLEPQGFGEICVYFFYGQNCPHCAAVEPLVERLTASYPEVKLKPYEVYFNNSNQKLFQDFNLRYGIAQPGIPTIFIGDRALKGESAIKDNLQISIEYFKVNGPICPETYKKVEGNAHEIDPVTDIKLTIPALVIAAAIDSINPCAFAVLIFLLVYLSALGAKRKILKVGITYIVAIFIIYFFSGLGLFTIIQSVHITRWVYYVAAGISILAGLINVKDFFWYGKGITLAIPESKKPLLQKYIQKATVPAAIILGILVALFELPCTGGVYLAILGLLSTKMTIWQGIPYLLVYNLIFVLPLFVILFAVYRGMPAGKAEAWRLEKRKWMKLAMGLMMIILGVIMLLGWV